MLKAPSSADIDRLRQFLLRLQTDAASNASDLAVTKSEVERLKREIAYLEAERSRAFLSGIAIDYGAAPPALPHV